MKKITPLILLAVLTIKLTGQVTIETNIKEEGKAMSQDLIGAFFEDINYGADGGLYAELVQNRSFEYYKVSGYTDEGPLAHWSLANSENLFSYSEVINDSPLNANNTNYLKLTISDKDTSSGGSNNYPFKGRIGVGSWATQAVYDSIKVVSGDKVWLNENFTDASNWDVREGLFSVSNGTYVQTSSSQPAWSVALTEIDTSVYTFTVQAMKTGGDEGFLFPFAYIDDLNYYWLNIGGWANTQHAIEKCTDGSKSTIASTNSSIENNVWYTFKIEVVHNICKFYIDNELLFEINTSSSNSDVVIDESGYAGIANTGYFGMSFDKDANYKFSTYLKSKNAYDGIVRVCLHAANGTVIACDTIENITTDWQKYELQLTASASSTDAYLSLLFNNTGVVYADMISLFPKETYKSRENGLRKDLAEAIADLNPQFLRFPGGCVSHGRGLDNAYRWKETIGDVAERTPNWNLWNYHQTYGLGFYEYFLYCEDMGAKPLPVLPVGISCQFREREIAPISEMGPWIQDAIDLIEFANGDASSEWGSKRAQMGHPEPFNMEYICLGNEEDDIPEFRERFIMFQDTIQKYYPEIKIIGTSGTDDVGAYYTSLWEFSTEHQLSAVDEHYYNSPQWFLENLHRYDNFDRNGPKVFIGEYASQDDRLFNAIAEAYYLTGVEKNADIIELTCYAPLLNYVEDISYHWHPDMILFNNTDVVKTANYYVQQLYGVHAGDEYINSTVTYQSNASASPFTGQIGVGSWATQVKFDDIKVVSNGQTIINEDFNADASNWQAIDGTWSVNSGTFNQSSAAEPAWNICNTVLESSEYTLTLKAMKTGGNEGFVIPFAFKDNQNYYWLNIGGWSNTQHAVEKAVNGTKSQLAVLTGAIANDTWYDIKIEVTESSVRCYLDGEQIFEITTPDGPVASSITKDHETNDVIIKLVNSDSEPVDATVLLNDVTIDETAQVITLSGSNADDRNSMEFPDMVAPVETSMTVSDSFNINLPGYSMTVIRFYHDTTKVINQTYKLSETDVVCNGESYTFPDDSIVNNITSPIVHSSKLKTVAGADSIIVTTVNVISIIETISQTENTLTADQDSADYNWANCNNTSEVLGTAQDFTVNESGEYAVLISYKGCETLSECVTVTINDIGALKNGQSGIEIYPNPANKVINVSVSAELLGSKVKIFDLSGKECLSFDINSVKDSYPIGELTAGIYQVSISDDKAVNMFRFLKN